MRFLTILFLVLFKASLFAQLSSKQYYALHYDLEKGDTTGFHAKIYGLKSTNKDNLYFLLAQGDYLMHSKLSKEALGKYLLALEKVNKNKKDTLFALVNYKIGFFYFYTDNYPQALKYFNATSLIYGSKPKNRLQAKLYIQIGLIHGVLGGKDPAEKNYKIALAYFRKINDLKRLAALQNNIALVYTARGDFENSKKYLDSCLFIREEQNDYYGIGQTFNNIGALYFKIQDYKIALDYYTKGYQNRIKAKAPQSGLIESQINIGKSYRKLDDRKNALYWLEQGLAEAKKNEHVELTHRACEQLKDVYYEMKDYNKAYETQALYFNLRDSLFGMDKKNAIENLGLQNEFDTRLQQDSITNAEERKAELAISIEKEKKTSIIFYSLGGGLLLLLIYAVQLFRSNVHKKKANALIQLQKDELDGKQKEIIDSINYAKRIQESLLPSDKFIAKSFERLRKGGK